MVEQQEEREVVEFDGDLAHVVRISGNRRIKEGTVSLPDLIVAMIRKNSRNNIVSTPMMIPGTRYYVKTGNMTEVVVVEDRPQMRTILTSEGTFHLAFPYVVYVFTIQNGHMPAYKSRIFFRNAPLESIDDQLFLCNLTHTNVDPAGGYGVGAVCMKAVISDEDPLTAKIAANLNYYWTTRFDWAGSNGFFKGFEKTKGQDIRISSLEEWQEASKKDPLFILSVSWLDAGTKLRDVISSVIGLRDDGENHGNTLRSSDDIADLVWSL